MTEMPVRRPNQLLTLIVQAHIALLFETGSGFIFITGNAGRLSLARDAASLAGVIFLLL